MSKRAAPGSGGSHVSRFVVRGQVVSRSGEALAGNPGPLVVLAIPTTGTRGSSRGTSVMRRANDEFSPSFLVVSAGGQVRFDNAENIYHRFFSRSEKNAFDLGMLEPGASRAFRFEHPGPVHVYCSLHSHKQATILVARTPHFAVVEPNGAFKIANLRPGSYVLETWGRGRATVSVELRVPSRDSSFVQIPLPAAKSQVSG